MSYYCCSSFLVCFLSQLRTILTWTRTFVVVHQKKSLQVRNLWNWHVSPSTKQYITGGYPLGCLLFSILLWSWHFPSSMQLGQNPELRNGMEQYDNVMMKLRTTKIFRSSVFIHPICFSHVSFSCYCLLQLFFIPSTFLQTFHVHGAILRTIFRAWTSWQQKKWI